MTKATRGREREGWFNGSQPVLVGSVLWCLGNYFKFVNLNLNIFVPYFFVCVYYMHCLQNKLTYMVYKLFDNLEIISLKLQQHT